MKKLALCALVVLGVSACGGKDKKPAPQVENKPNQSETQLQPKPDNNTTAGKADMAYIFDVSDVHRAHRPVKDFSMTHLVVDGKRFELTGKDPKVEGLISLNHVKLGYVEKGYQHGSVFYVGETTKQMPATGTAKYVGTSSFSYRGKDGDDDIMHPTVHIDVDFGSKMLKGNVQNLVTFDAKIMSEQAFFHSPNVRGMFFGPNAAEIGGIYQDSKLTGMFGAKKQ